MPSIINASTSNGLIQSADTSGVLELQSGGSTKLTVASTGAYGQLQSATAQASTSGTSIDFTSIPSWVKRITVMFNNVSTSGTSFKLIQLGSGSVTTTGYISTASAIYNNPSTMITTSTFGMIIYSLSATDAINGQMIFTNVSGNIWVSSHIGMSSSASTICGGGNITLSNVLDRVRITTVNGTDTFDAGSINIMYEG
jgi:hypothetical protein